MADSANCLPVSGSQSRLPYRIERSNVKIISIAGTFPERIVYIASIFYLPAMRQLMDEISYLGLGFTLAIFGLACLMAMKLSSKSAYH